MRAHSFAIRTDASRDIGSGHVMRCLALAEGLAARGARVRFLCRDVPGNMIGRIEGEGHAVARLAPSGDAGAARDAKAVAAVLGSDPVDWLIVDHYGLDAQFESSLRGHARKIMVIDDLADRDHDCDLLLDQNLNSDPFDRYRGRVGASTQCLFGPRYALMRPAFKEAWRVRSGPVRRILVFFGGSDRPNATAVAVAAIGRMPEIDLHVDVVIGDMYQGEEGLAAFCADRPNFRIWRNADMAALMRQADVAIGAGGTTTWERCAARLPALVWPIADNQRTVLTELAASGAIYLPDTDSTGADALARHLYALINNAALRSFMAARSRALCDGRGVDRVIAAIEGAELSVAPATEADCEIAFRWRNHPAVRANSTQTEPIALSDHEQWFRTSLPREDRLLLVGRLEDTPVGVVRYDRVNSTEAEVSIYLDPGLLGRGLGGSLLNAGEVRLFEVWPDVTRIVATVIQGNAASMRLFENSGYNRQSTIYEKRRLN